MKSEEIQKIIDTLKKKIESMVWGQVFVREEYFGPSIAIEIYSYRTLNPEAFKYVISLAELNYSCDYLGPEVRLDLISKRIVDEYKNAILKQFIKED